jgi:hypothetical protein
MTVKDHYDTHLAKVYSWMLGDFSTKMSEQMNFFRQHSVVPIGNGVAFDLGAGNGIQSVALATLGFNVQAVDFNRQLLDELDINKSALPVTTVENDILSFVSQHRGRPEVIVCMGDTLTHLSNRAEVSMLIAAAAKALANGGKLVLSFRDLSKERTGTDRFLHVRSDNLRIMTCFLEYFPEILMVHDIVNEKTGNQWTQNVSAYPKVRLSVATVKEMLKLRNLRLLHEAVLLGMTYLISSKSD